jgi:antitoxin component HigA of HigAB toxin-antitoxin module
MEIRPIRNDDDHAAALREIEKLWGAAAGTEEGDKLDILSTLVEKHEDTRWPSVDISDPIDLLNYAIEEFGHSQYLESQIGIAAHPSRRPLRGLLRMRSNLLKHNNLMLRSERRERLEAWAASDSPISHSQY